MALQWTKALSVGVEDIDAQHRELFRRAQGLLDALHHGEPGEITAVIEFLHAYTVEHFGAEEAAMREARFRGYERHKAEHDRFVSDLLAFAREHARGGAGAFFSLKVSHWLTRWLQDHVSGSDTELGAFLRQRQSA